MSMLTTPFYDGCALRRVRVHFLTFRAVALTRLLSLFRAVALTRLLSLFRAVALTRLLSLFRAVALTRLLSLFRAIALTLRGSSWVFDSQPFMYRTYDRSRGFGRSRGNFSRGLAPRLGKTKPRLIRGRLLFVFLFALFLSFTFLFAFALLFTALFLFVLRRGEGGRTCQNESYAKS